MDVRSSRCSNYDRGSATPWVRSTGNPLANDGYRFSGTATEPLLQHAFRKAGFAALRCTWSPGAGVHRLFKAGQKREHAISQAESLKILRAPSRTGGLYLPPATASGGGFH